MTAGASDWLYDGQVRGFAARATPVERRELHMHFGHWDAPPAQPNLAALPEAQERLDAFLRRLAAPPSGAVLLDVGCGVGGTIAGFVEDGAVARAVGLNCDPRQLALAARLVSAPPRCAVEWVAGDACALPFAGASFDVVTAVECIPHFASRAVFCAEVARVLRRGGRLVISDFVATPELRALRDRGALPAGLERAIARDLQPWTDLHEDLGGTVAHAARAGLALDVDVDATEETLPTYRVLLRDGALPLDVPAGTPPDPARGMSALEWLQARGLLRMRYQRFVRAA